MKKKKAALDKGAIPDNEAQAALKRVEEALRESKLRFRATFEQAAVGIAYVGPDGRWLDMNRKLCEIVGYTREELLARTFQSITHPDDIELDLSYMRQLIAGEIPHFSMEKRYLRKNGEIVWVNLTVAIVRNPGGDPDYFIGVIEDISERKRAERKQLESERKYRQLTEQASEGIFVVDQKGRYLEVNPAGLEMVGYSLEEMRAMTIVDLMPPDDIKKNPPRLPEIVAGKTVINERTLRRKDGSFFQAEITAKLMSDGNVLATKRDITKRKRREDEKAANIHHLMSLNRIYRAFEPMLDLETAMPVALKEILSIFDCDRAWLLYPLDKDAKTYKIPFEQTKPEYPGAFTSSKELPVTKEVAEIFKAALEASAPVSMNLVEGITDEAQLKEFDIKTQLVVSLYPKTGKPWKLGMHQCSRVREWTKEERELFHAISLVISDKLSNLLLVRNLGESEERHRILFNNASVGIGISSEGGEIVDANETLLEMMGYSRRELMGMRFNDLFAVQEDKGSLSGRLSKEDAVHDFEAKLRKKDGSEFIANLTVTRYNLGGKQVTQAMILDITERKKAETELRESEASIRALVEHSPIAIIIDVGVETDEKIIMMNQKFTDLFGYTIADVPDVRHWWPLAYPDEKYREELRIEWLARVEKALQSRSEIKPMEATVVCKNGSSRYVRIGLASIGSINIVTFEDLTERKRNEAVNTSRLHLLQFSATHTLDELLEETLNETEKLTGSSIGFYHFVEDDQNSLTLQAWSTRTKAQFCKAEGKGLHYAISEAGVWVDCVYQHKPVIHNDYASLPSRKGMPEGHAEVVRELVVPVYRGGKVKAILGVGNKPSNYTEHDTEIVSLLADLAWEIAERKRAEDVKQEAVNRLQKIASRVPGVVYQFRLRPDGGFCFPYASDALRDICRVNPEEVIEDASKAFAAVHPDDFPPLMAAVQASAKDLSLWQEEFRVKFDDGVVRHLLGNAIPEREAGGATLWHGVITDITERKRAEEKLRESGEILERIFETTHVHIVLLDSKFNFIRVNKAYADVCGFPPDYFIGKNHFDLFPSEELESKFLRVVQTGEPYTVYSRPFEFPDQPQLGVTYWDLALYPVKGIAGQVDGLLFTLLEVTERVRAEKALIAAKELAERANKAKSVFLSSMSHEIRTPLTSVIGFSQLLATDEEHPLSDFQKELLGKVMVSGDQLLELINSALDLAKIESGDIQVSIEAVDMKSLATMALTSAAHLAKDHGVRLSSKAPSFDCYVMADSILLRQVLTNLLSNAIKFNKKGGETVLFWKPLKESRVRISVSDEGIGIPSDKIKNLYKPFDRLGMEGRSIKGFGVGLAIVKRLVESMGGEVGVESEVGKGSTFYIDLPAGRKP